MHFADAREIRVGDQKVTLWGRSLTCQLTESLTPWIGSGEMRIRWVRDPFNRQTRGLPHKVTFRSHTREIRPDMSRWGCFAPAQSQPLARHSERSSRCFYFSVFFRNRRALL